MNQVGRYQITGELGRGAMGVVYRALDPAIGRTAAIKTIHLTDLTDATERSRVAERLRKEAQAVGTLSHPNIVTVYDFIETEDFAYIVMEYVAGPSLEALLRNGKTPGRDELIVFLRQVAAALDYAQRKGIVHRDIKPANILVAEPFGGGERTVKITDFGVAREVSSEGTQSGALIGTPSYMSPEQIEGRATTGREDQYSLAVVVYEVLSGVKPLAADSLPALLNLICHTEPRLLEQLNANVSGTVSRVVQRALAKDPAARYPTVSDFVGALSIALAEANWEPTGSRPAGSRAAMVNAAAAAATARAYQLKPRSASPIATGRLEPGSILAGEENSPAAGPTLKKLGLIVFLCFAVAAAIMFIVRMNSAQQIQVQVINPEGQPASPPPGGTETASVRTPAKTRPANAPATTPAATPKSSFQPSTPAKSPGRAPASAAASGGSTAAEANSGGTSADVDLLTEPAGAHVVVDNRSDAVCTAPCTMALPGGRHTLTAELNGYSLARRIFNVPETRSVYIPLAQSSGVLLLTTVPSGSAVLVDGQAAGQTPLTLHLAPGLHQITISYGAARRQETVNIEPATFQSRSMHW